MQFKITCMTSDGIVSSYIDNKNYVYKIDTAFYPKIKELYKRNPGQALNLLKKKGILWTE